MRSLRSLPRKSSPLEAAEVFCAVEVLDTNNLALDHGAPWSGLTHITSELSQNVLHCVVPLPVDHDG